MPVFENFYPVTICEARYGGTYAEMGWVLIGGTKHPRQTDAFGADDVCMAFFDEVFTGDRGGAFGGIVEHTGDDDRPRDLLVAVGKTPGQALTNAHITVKNFRDGDDNQ